MKNSSIFLWIFLSLLIFYGCNEIRGENQGRVCLGDDLDTLFEALPDKGVCKKGDIIVTKNPAIWCDFTKTVVFNSYNSAACSYIGQDRDIIKANGFAIPFKQFVEELSKKKGG